MKERYLPPTAHTRLKNEEGTILRSMAEKTADLCVSMLVRLTKNSVLVSAKTCCPRSFLRFVQLPSRVDGREYPGSKVATH